MLKLLAALSLASAVALPAVVSAPSVSDDLPLPAVSKRERQVSSFDENGNLIIAYDITAAHDGYMQFSYPLNSASGAIAYPVNTWNKAYFVLEYGGSNASLNMVLAYDYDLASDAPWPWLDGYLENGYHVDFTAHISRYTTSGSYFYATAACQIYDLDGVALTSADRNWIRQPHTITLVARSATSEPDWAQYYQSTQIIPSITDGLGVVSNLATAFTGGFDSLALNNGALTNVMGFAFTLLGIGVAVGIAKLTFNWVTGRHGM